MADVYKGLTIKFGAETSALSDALKEIRGEARNITGELRKIDNALKFNPGNTDLLRQKQHLLGKQITNTKEQLDALKQAQAKLSEADVGSDQYRALQREIIETSSKLKTLEEKAESTDRALKGGPERAANWKALGKGIAIAGAAIAAAATAAGVALAGLTKQAVENADELQKQADITGLTAERIQELQFVGKNLGVELEAITGAQAKLIKAMAKSRDSSKSAAEGMADQRVAAVKLEKAQKDVNEAIKKHGKNSLEARTAQAGLAKVQAESAAAGKGQSDAFKQLGVSITDSKGQLRDANVVMAEALTALSNVKNETERTALAQKIFGKGAATLNPIIRAGGDELKKLADQARDSGAVMSNEAVAGLDAFGDTTENLKAAIIGTFGEVLAPELEGAAKWATTWVKEHGPAVKETLKGIADEAERAGKKMHAAFADPEVQTQVKLLSQNLNMLSDSSSEVDAEISKETWTDLLVQGIGLLNVNMATAKLKSDGMRLSMSSLGVVIAALKSPFQSQSAAMRDSSKATRDFSRNLDAAKGHAVNLISSLFGLGPAMQTRLSIAFQQVINGLIDDLNLAIRAYNKLPLKDIATIPRVGVKANTSNVKIGQIPRNATGGSYAPNQPRIIEVGDQRGVYEHVLRDDQIVSLMQRAMASFGGGAQRSIELHIHGEVKSYSDTRRAVRDAAEELAWT